MIESLFLFHLTSDCVNEVRELFDNAGVSSALAEPNHTPISKALRETSGREANYSSCLQRTCAVEMRRSHPRLMASSESQVNS